MNKTSILRTSLDLLFYSGASHALAAPFRGMGAIFMLHHIHPDAAAFDEFAPNAGLEVTPDFLSQVIEYARNLGYDPISLGDAVERIKSGKSSDRPFVVFTIDDGYLDNLEHALPVFRQHDCPFTIFVSPAITDGVCELWWRGLEAVVAGTNKLAIEVGDKHYDLDTSTASQKIEAYEKLYWPVRQIPEFEQRKWIRKVCTENGIDLDVMCRTCHDVGTDT